MLRRAHDGHSSGNWSRLELQGSYDFRTSQEARNSATDNLLTSPCEWLLMIDNDTKLVNDAGPVDPFKLIDCAVDHNLRVVAAPIPVLQGSKWYINMFQRVTDRKPDQGWHAPLGLGALKSWESSSHLPHPVDAAGTGMILIHRSVFEELQDYGLLGIHETINGLAPSEQEPLHDWTSGLLAQHDPTEDLPYWLRPREPSGRTIIGEDLLFSERCRHLDPPVQPHVLPSLYCGHLHTVDLARIPSIIYSLAEPPTAADYGLETLGGLTPSVMSIEPWQAKVLRDLTWECPRVELPDLGSSGVMVEFGGGISTWVLGENQELALVTVETDETQRSKLLHASTQVISRFEDGCAVRMEDLDPRVVFVFIDGPQVTSDNPHARFNTLPQIPESLLVNGCLIVVDDYHRATEKDAVEFWKSRLSGTLRQKRVYGPPTREMAVFEYHKP